MAKHSLKTGVIIKGIENVNFLAILQKKEKIDTFSGIINYIIEKYRQYRPDIEIDVENLLNVKRQDPAKKTGKTINRKPREKSQKQLEAEAFERALTRMMKQEERKRKKEVESLAKEKIDNMSAKSFTLDDFLF